MSARLPAFRGSAPILSNGVIFQSPSSCFLGRDNFSLASSASAGMFETLNSAMMILFDPLNHGKGKNFMRINKFPSVAQIRRHIITLI